MNGLRPTNASRHRLSMTLWMMLACICGFMGHSDGWAVAVLCLVAVPVIALVSRLEKRGGRRF